MTIRILPNKVFCRSLKDRKISGNIAVIMSSSYPFDEVMGQLKNKLLLSYDDVREYRKGRSFDNQKAQKIKSFFLSLDESISDLYICCDAGESRSAAIAVAILRFMDKDEMIIWKNPKYHPNPYIYKILCDEFGTSVSKIGLKYRCFLNNRAFKLAIKKSRKN